MGAPQLIFSFVMQAWLLTTMPVSVSEQNENTTNDTLKVKSIKGKILFRIKVADFFQNHEKVRISSKEDMSNYIPTFFYFDKGVFFIPNRLDHEIYEIDTVGKIRNKIAIPSKRDITKFFISEEGLKYILGRSVTDPNVSSAEKAGLEVLNGDNKIIQQNFYTVSIDPHPANNDVFFLNKSENDKEYAWSDKKKRITHPMAIIPSYATYCFDEQFCYELNYENETSPVLKQYDLNFKLVSENQYVLGCERCGHGPKILSKDFLIGSTYGKEFFDELILLTGKKAQRFRLETEIHSKPLLDLELAYMMTNGYLYWLDKNHKRLYSLATTEKEVVVIEYPLPEVR
jgi:hypothetical protein